VHADPILAPGDPILAFDFDVVSASGSSYPYNNAAIRAIDGNPITKYENTGGARSGLILVPVSGASVVKSFTITSAPDRPQNDPASWELYGTNDAVISTENSTGSAENWTLIGSGTIAVPTARQTVSAAVPVTNTTSYTAYRIIFPDLKNDPAAATSLQFSEIQLYDAANATGTPILSSADQILPIQFPVPAVSSYPGAESPPMVIDGSIDTKYLNFGEFTTGFIITPTTGASTVQAFEITTANDATERDPSSWSLYGTNADIVSQDNSDGGDEAWTLIEEGTITLPDARKTPGGLVFLTNNTTAYKSYRMTFPTVRNAAAANSMQLAEIQFYGNSAGTSPIFAPGDPIIAVAVPGSKSSTANNGANNESPPFVLDGNPATKYLNFGKMSTGFIVTPAGGASTVRSFVITTANDVPGRDPSTWELAGTNDPVTDGDNSNGAGENWTPIGSGALSLPDERQTAGPVVTFANSTPYTSYRLTFPNLKDTVTTNSMQIADAQFYASTDGTGTGLLTSASSILAVQTEHSASNSPAAEAATMILDGNTATKYYNGGGPNSGFIVTPAAGSSIVTGFTIATANDVPGRDPATWELYGTNSAVIDFNNGYGDMTPGWQLISTDTLALPDDRFFEAPAVTFANTKAYTSYRFVVISVKDSATPAAQYSEFQLNGTLAAPVDTFPISSITRNAANGNITLTWPSTAGQTFRVAYNTDLSNWNGTVQDNIPAQAGTSTTLTFPSPLPTAGRVFFRVERK
jgi:hypothetical protein